MHGEQGDLKKVTEYTRFSFFMFVKLVFASDPRNLGQKLLLGEASQTHICLSLK